MLWKKVLEDKYGSRVSSRVENVGGGVAIIFFPISGCFRLDCG